MAGNPSDEIIRRELDTGAENPGVEVAEAVADIEGTDPTQIGTIYERVDDTLDRLFSNPPEAEAQMEITFSYEGYRITVTQDGAAEFLKIE
jgi:hypothetical protein